MTITTEEWETLWHHLCARLAELRRTALSLDAAEPGWGHERLGRPISELEEWVARAARLKDGPNVP